MANPNVDLRQLARRRDGPPTREIGPRRRHLLTRYALPGAVLLGFAGVLLWAARDRLLPARPVTVVPVVTTRAEVSAEGTPLFQAAGWVEPRPTPTMVTALAEGVVEKLFVVEGQQIQAGETVAQLVRADADLALRAAEADRELRRSEVQAARAALTAARTNLAKPAHLQAAVAEAEALLAQKDAELAALPFQTAAAKARLGLARQSYAGRLSAASALPAIEVQRAKSDLDAAEAVAAELQGRAARLRAEVTARQSRRDALRLRLDLKTDETRAADEALAGLRAAEARVAQAEVALAAARLRLDRMCVRAPVSGRVLALLARPGSRVMGLVPGSLQEASTVLSMYDPVKLQVRADVRLEDVPRVQTGQKIRIETPAAPDGPLDGSVLQMTSQADIQKNTLQVKVSVDRPPPTLRPDMLVRVTFLAPPTPRTEGQASSSLRVLIPRRLVESAEGGARVWVADLAGGVARVRTVKLGRTAGELVEALDGLNPTDRLIVSGRDGLVDGERIAVTGEEPGQPGTGTH